jgi:hypothetical protein
MKMATTNPNDDQKNVPVDTAKRDDSKKDEVKKDDVSKDDSKKDDTRVQETQEDQKLVKQLDKEVKGKTEYERQEIYGRHFEDKEGEDSFRKAARLERERDAEMSKGDPTRDPVAKQAAMDANTHLPGAAEDAEKIVKVGEKNLDRDTDRRNLSGGKAV